jgi:hypothetical protein
MSRTDRATNLIIVVLSAVEAAALTMWRAPTASWAWVIVIAVVTATANLAFIGRHRPYSAYMVGHQRRALATLIDASAEGVALVDPVDTVALVCHRAHGRRSRYREVSRIHLADLQTAISNADRDQSATLIIERFILGTRIAPVVARRVEPWAVRVDHDGHLVPPPDVPTPALTALQWDTVKALILTTGVGFASVSDAELLVAQLRRATSPPLF